MGNTYSQSRRDLLKTTVAGSTGLIVSDGLIKTVLAGDTKNTGRGIEINPKINNLRVVYIEDPDMLSDGTSTSFGTFDEANTKIDADKVKENMDKMACALANNSNVEESWATIFQKPANKDWEDLKIAIKPNCAAGGSNGQKYPHAVIPIINTVCNALINLGAKGTNMTIYDTNGFSVNPATLYPASSMVDGIKFLGPRSRVWPVPMWQEVSPAAITADIIVNIASCKGHSALGGTTLTLKNHLGTVGGHVTTVKPIIDIHNSEAVLGNPSDTVPPKQQLAIVDCLWTAKSGPTAAPDKVPCMIVMGTSCPAVDCFTAIKVRLEKLNYSGTRSTFISYCTQYGYDADTDIEPLLVDPSPDPDALGRAWLDANKWNPTGTHPNTSPSLKSTIVKFSVIGAHFKPVTRNISLKLGENIKSISIVNMKGRIIRNLSLQSSNNLLPWDARNDKGRSVSAGTYILRIAGTKTEKAVKFNLSK